VNNLQILNANCEVCLMGGQGLAGFLLAGLVAGAGRAGGNVAVSASRSGRVAGDVRNQRGGKGMGLLRSGGRGCRGYWLMVMLAIWPLK
jgi:hypothetical protein